MRLDRVQVSKGLEYSRHNAICSFKKYFVVATGRNDIKVFQNTIYSKEILWSIVNLCTPEKFHSRSVRTCNPSLLPQVAIYLFQNDVQVWIILFHKPWPVWTCIIKIGQDVIIIIEPNFSTLMIAVARNCTFASFFIAFTGSSIESKAKIEAEKVSHRRWILTRYGLGVKLCCGAKSKRQKHLGINWLINSVGITHTQLIAWHDMVQQTFQNSSYKTISINIPFWLRSSVIGWN